jgi:hypothetical protein
MSALARCLADKWGEAPDAEPAQPAEAATEDAPAVI